MEVTIKIVGNVLGTRDVHDHRYIKHVHFDVDKWGRAEIFTTADRLEAMTFPDSAAAFEFWKHQSRRAPLRDDGRPNRPLTAYTVEIERISAAD